MPVLGEIQHGFEIGKKGSRNRYIWNACGDCGKERWVLLRHNAPLNLRCHGCSNKLKRPHRKHVWMQGDKNSNWRGGRSLTKDGYIRVLTQPANFFYPMANHSYVLEHRLVMARHLGRCLQDWELVHHLNGIKTDNRLANLCLTMEQYHDKHTVNKQLQERIKHLEARVTLLEAELVLSNAEKGITNSK